jgi:hypothetical protein
MAIAYSLNRSWWRRNETSVENQPDLLLARLTGEPALSAFAKTDSMRKRGSPEVNSTLATLSQFETFSVRFGSCRVGVLVPLPHLALFARRMRLGFFIHIQIFSSN